MLRSATFQRSMARLALIAVLLMALAPAVGRWVKSDSLQFLSGLTEICTTSGLKSLDVSGWGGDAAKIPAPAHSGMDADCAYCPLLAGTALLLFAFALLFPQVLAILVPAFAPFSFRSSSVFPGLGSRGPPLAL